MDIIEVRVLGGKVWVRVDGGEARYFDATKGVSQRDIDEAVASVAEITEHTT